MKKVLVLEDNPTMLEHLSNIIRGIEIKCEVYGFNNVKEAYSCAIEKEIDLFVVDIILDTKRPGDSTGLNFVENIRNIERYGLVPVIFVTSLEDAKLYTYEKLHCYSFIEKPFDVERVKTLVEQCLRYKGVNREKTLYFRKDGIILAVERKDIVFAESNHHILIIHTQNGDVMNVPYVAVKKFLADVDSRDFIQCSRNTVINTKYIHNVDIPNRMIQMKDNLGRIEIGVMYKKQMKEIFK